MQIVCPGLNAARKWFFPKASKCICVLLRLDIPLIFPKYGLLGRIEKDYSKAKIDVT